MLVPHVPAHVLLPRERVVAVADNDDAQQLSSSLGRALATAALAREWRMAEDLRQIEERGGRDTAELLEYLRHMHADLLRAIAASSSSSHQTLRSSSSHDDAVSERAD